jgi:hypothetical protein
MRHSKRAGSSAYFWAFGTDTVADLAEREISPFVDKREPERLTKRRVINRIINGKAAANGSSGIAESA